MAEMAEEVEQQDGEADAGGEGGVAVAAPPTKPKKGKAALPLKRDRVCLKIAFFMRLFYQLFCLLEWFSAAFSEAEGEVFP